MSSPNSSLSEGLVPKLTQAEQEVLSMIKEGIFNNSQIAARRQTGIRNIQKIIKNLRQKGALGISSPIANKTNHTNELSEQIRLHAEQFTIIPINKSQKYIDSINKKIIIDDNTILVHNDIIQYYCHKSFFGSDSWAATAKAMEYHDRVLRTLENDLGVILIKSRSQNITRVKSEYAHIKNGLAKTLEQEGEKFKARTTDEGRVWFIIDNSWNLHEAETIGRTAQRDMQRVIEPFFNDMRDKDNYLPSDTKSMLDKLTLISSNVLKQQQQTLLIEQEYAANIKKHLSVLSNIDNSFKTFTKEIAKFNQRKLSDY